VERDTVMDLNTHQRCGRTTGMNGPEGRIGKDN